MRVSQGRGGALRELPRQAARVREAVAPGWLVDIVRPKPVTVPWPLMIRAALAICVPMAAGLLAHDLAPGLLAAMGGLVAVIVDVGGPYLARLKRVGSAAVFGGAVGLTVGTAIHGRGWTAVVVLVLLAGVSVVVSEMGSTGSVVGLQLLVFASLSLGPLGGLRPWWTGPLEFLSGVAWAMILIIPGWILDPRSAEQHSVAEVYRALAARLRSIGTDSFAADRRALTAALNGAYDQVLTARSGIGGGNPQLQPAGRAAQPQLPGGRGDEHPGPGGRRAAGQRGRRGGRAGRLDLLRQAAARHPASLERHPRRPRALRCAARRGPTDRGPADPRRRPARATGPAGTPARGDRPDPSAGSPGCTPCG